MKLDIAVKNDAATTIDKAGLLLTNFVTKPRSANLELTKLPSEPAQTSQMASALTKTGGKKKMESTTFSLKNSLAKREAAQSSGYNIAVDAPSCISQFGNPPIFSGAQP